MNDSEVMTVLIILVSLCGGAFFWGRSTGDDYWHKPCNQYSISAYATDFVPARCVGANDKPVGS